MDLNELFARELAQILNQDPELAEEVTETRSVLRQWVSEQVQRQTEDDEMSPAVRRFIRQHLKTAEVMEWL